MSVRFADSKSVRLPLPRRTSRARACCYPTTPSPNPPQTSPTAGEVIARIPKSGCITRANCARSDAISKLRVSMGGDEQWLAILGAALLLERTSFSDLGGHLILRAPREESDVVASWPDDRRRFLAGTDIEQALRDERAQARSEWDGHVAKVVRDATSDVDDDSRPGFDDYLAADPSSPLAAFTVDDAVGVGLVPVADMFNHRTGGNHVCVADVEDAFAIPAAARSAAGEPSMYVRARVPRERRRRGVQHLRRARQRETSVVVRFRAER